MTWNRLLFDNQQFLTVESDFFPLFTENCSFYRFSTTFFGLFLRLKQHKVQDIGIDIFRGSENLGRQVSNFL